MATFRNKNFTKRDYESTNIVFCAADVAPTTPDNRWIEDDADLSKFTKLYIENGVAFYGYL